MALIAAALACGRRPGDTARVNRVPAILLALLPAACDGPQQVHELHGPTMGSFYRVKWVGTADPAAVQRAVADTLAEFDRAFSLWRDDSEIAACNSHRGRRPFPCSPLFAAVLVEALAVAERTGGAFDPTVRPLSRLFRRQKEGGEPPGADELAAALSRVGHHRVRVAREGVWKDAPDLELDLDGIVAGACADQLARRLRELGVQGAMLEITGEVLCFGEKAPGVPWRIAIESPDGDVDGAGPRTAVSALALRDRALCTSGSYRNFVQGGAAPIHHIFDPRSGRNVDHGVVSVSVLARSCALADALGTALMVVGPAGAERLLADWPGEPELGALFVVVREGKAEVREVRWPSGS